MKLFLQSEEADQKGLVHALIEKHPPFLPKRKNVSRRLDEVGPQILGKSEELPAFHRVLE
jgi:hypothetical protein